MGGCLMSLICTEPVHNLDAVALPCENELARKARPEIASVERHIASWETL